MTFDDILDEEFDGEGYDDVYDGEITDALGPAFNDDGEDYWLGDDPMAYDDGSLMGEDWIDEEDPDTPTFRGNHSQARRNYYNADLHGHEIAARLHHRKNSLVDPDNLAPGGDEDNTDDINRGYAEILPEGKIITKTQLFESLLNK